MVRRANGFRISSKKEKFDIVCKVLKELAKGTSEEAKLARATLMVVEE